MDGSHFETRYPVVLRFEGIGPENLAGYEKHRKRVGGDIGHVLKYPTATDAGAKILRPAGNVDLGGAFRRTGLRDGVMVHVREHGMCRRMLLVVAAGLIISLLEGRGWAFAAVVSEVCNANNVLVRCSCSPGHCGHHSKKRLFESGFTCAEDVPL
ncbi:hypothetical protein [Pseudorhodobacter turbinis]|uniref:hypothetical protein n=1 Tax=Pseudorhodobacter turbinis TaxID=2500533 RepID=UPI00143CDDE8|nr:hypothetical protein [Pseudorhodobacter turbinis]